MVEIAFRPQFTPNTSSLCGEGIVECPNKAAIQQFIDTRPEGLDVRAACSRCRSELGGRACTAEVTLTPKNRFNPNTYRLGPDALAQDVPDFRAFIPDNDSELVATPA